MNTILLCKSQCTGAVKPPTIYELRADLEQREVYCCGTGGSIRACHADKCREALGPRISFGLHYNHQSSFITAPMTWDVDLKYTCIENNVRNISLLQYLHNIDPLKTHTIPRVRDISECIRGTHEIVPCTVTVLKNTRIEFLLDFQIYVLTVTNLWLFYFVF